MRSRRGQALVELALCVPFVLTLALGSVAVVQIMEAHAGLEAATVAAADAAVRAPDPITAVKVARQRFMVVVAGYPMRAATLDISVGGFARAGELVAASSALADVGWLAMGLPERVPLHARTVLRIEPWRTRRNPP